MEKSIITNHSIFNQDLKEEVISISKDQNIKGKLQKINVVHDKNNEISETKNVNNNKNEDEETDTESDVTENENHAKEEEASKLKSMKNDQSKKILLYILVKSIAKSQKKLISN